jgi:hypothetical protein
MSPARRESGADGSKSNRGNGLCVSGTVLSTNARRARGFDCGTVRAARRLIQCRPATLGHGALVTMDDAKVLQACRLLHEALCDDLELRQLLVQVDRDRVSLTVRQKRGGRESRVIMGEDSPPDNIHPLDEWR